MRRFLRAVVRVVYVEKWDPVEGSYKYLNTNTGILQVEKPKLLGSELWKPNNIIEWDMKRVILWLRRIGLKIYAGKFEEYEVDGRALVLLDDEDFDNMEIFNKIHRKKIWVEIKRIFTLESIGNMARAHEIRREKIRKAKLFNASAVFLQRCYRGYYARNMCWNMREVKRVNNALEEAVRHLEGSKSWWLERELTYTLPPVKQFGRKRDHLSGHGWGRFHNGSFEPLGIMGYKDGNPTKKFTEKLKQSFYDAKRLEEFRAAQEGRIIANTKKPSVLELEAAAREVAPADTLTNTGNEDSRL
jgi:hypothetical protein